MNVHSELTSAESFEAQLASAAVEVSGVVPSEEAKALLASAARGHSPSARSLVNASDAVVGLAVSVPPKAPSQRLRERLLTSVAAWPEAASRTDDGTAAAPVSSAPPSGSALVSPCDALIAIQKSTESDQVRRLVVERRGAFGLAHPSGQSSTERARIAAEDDALRVLLEHLAAFVTFDVLFVSCVYGDTTVHRVHRGFPAAMGNVDVVPREVSYCTHAVATAEDGLKAGAPFVVEDAESEAFFRRGMVLGTGAKSYLGVPITVIDDEHGEVAVGALCCVGGAPRRIDANDVRLNALLARRAQGVVRGDLSACLDPTTDPVVGLPVYDVGFFAALCEIAEERAHAAPAHVLVFDPARVTGDPARFAPTDVVGRVAEGKLGVLVPAPIGDGAQAQASRDALERLSSMGPLEIQSLVAAPSSAAPPSRE